MRLTGSRWRPLGLAIAGSLVLAAVALSDSTAPRSPVTKQVAGVPCSVTARLALDAAGGTMAYGGGVSCAGNVGEKTIDVVPQVFNAVNGRPLWFSISLAGLYQGPVNANPLRLSGTRTYVPSHTYRLLVYGRAALPDGRASSETACVGCTGPASLSIRPSSTLRARPPTALQVPGIPCTVGQNGLAFKLINSSYALDYGAFAACGTAHGRRSITVCAQVANRINGKARWFSVTGSCVSRGPTSTNPLTLGTARTAQLGHGYRIRAQSTIVYPTAHGNVTRSQTLYSAASAP
jgi:hypothetical protein